MFLPSLKKAKKALIKPQGFTLIELLVVIGILAILLAIVLIAVNPPRQFALARNTQRRSDVLAILNSVGQYFAEHGALPDAISTSSANVSSSGADLCVDSKASIVPTFLALLPLDPETGTSVGDPDCSGGAYNTGYTIQRNANNRVTVSAPDSEDPDGGPSGPTISITR